MSFVGMTQQANNLDLLCNYNCTEVRDKWGHVIPVLDC